MINELAEANAYLNGENINPRNLYRTCYLILKWYRDKGYEESAARDALFAWGKQFNVFIKYDVNYMVQYIWNYDPRPLSARERVRVSEDDVFEIVKRFDRRKVRITAFALLLYAKAFADENGEIAFSYAELSARTGLDASSIRKTYMPELLMFKFCEMARTDNRPFFKHGKTIHPRTKIKLLVPIQQDGEYEFDDDFIPQFDQIFASRNLRDMYYYGII